MEGKKSKEYYKMPVKKHFGADIFEKLADQFLGFCEERRLQKYGALEGALRVFMALGSDLQIKLMSGNQKDVRAILIEGLLEAEDAAFLRSLDPERRKELLASAKRDKQKVSRKK